ncbi:alpha/beta hydrolase family protein [Undibacterium arcticum]
MTKPLFVVQGKNDPRVPLNEAEQIVARVRKNQVPVWYLMADNEGHGFARKPNADFYFFSVVRFLEQNLFEIGRRSRRCASGPALSTDGDGARQKGLRVDLTRSPFFHRQPSGVQALIVDRRNSPLVLRRCVLPYLTARQRP